MAKRSVLNKASTTDELLRDLMIVQLGLAKVGQRQIREIVGVDIVRVNRIVSRLRAGRQNASG